MLKILQRWGAAAAIALAAASAARAEFPERPIRILVGFGAGGASDVAARVIAKAMGDRLGQQVVVENRPGASTSIAGDLVAKSAPDGYTLFLCGNANAVNAIGTPKPPFDVLTDFAPIGVAINTPSVLVAPGSVEITSLRDLIERAKREPGQIMYASSGAASVSHIAGELMAHDEGIKLTHVPYKGSSQAMTDLLAGRVQIMFSPISTALPFIHNRQLVALAVTSDKRNKDLPDTPTLKEAGAKTVDLSIWSGLVAPKGTPSERIAKLGAALQGVLNSREVHDQLAVNGIEPVLGAGPDAFTAHMKADIATLQRLMAQTGMQIGE